MGTDPSHGDHDPPDQASYPASSSTWLNWLKLLAAFLLLWLAFRGVQFEQFGEALGLVNGGWLLLVVVTVLLSILAKAWRWSYLLKPVVPAIRPVDIIGSLLSGQAFNLLGVFRSGDLVRSFLASNGDSGRIPAILTGMLIEKAIDMVMLALAFLSVLPFLPVEILSASNWRTLLALGIGALILGVGIVGSARPVWKRIRPWLETRHKKPLDRLVALGDRFVEGLIQLGHVRGKGWVVISTLAAWALMLSTNMALSYGMGLDIPTTAGLVVLVLVLLGVAPNIMPGQIGPFYFFARYGLEQFGVEAAASTAFAVLLHASVLLPPLIGTGLYLFFSGRWNLLRKIQDR